jgi:hypothetical protein
MRIIAIELRPTPARLCVSAIELDNLGAVNHRAAIFRDAKQNARNHDNKQFDFHSM